MALVPKVWQHTATATIPADLVDDVATVATIIIANPTGNDALVEMHIGSTIILPPYEVKAGSSKTLDVRSLNASDLLPLVVESDETGVTFTASGVEYVP